ncbi:lytic transglycosylase domain-containing protein [Pseudarthrobacter sp. J75]|uniref:aggregation-promoting factor C-terminal-like domain-containing protein n=1 Tax=unclassified Pseudarthrobacter TaxID=2647000 RepID=UPI002E8071AF|nr:MULTISPECIES: lytic transglycosylase domain-containing protein [unclassified Pseudarthrobacter]MEE2523426.1 lytic transglycosylase domain-containing protein [Pseudarthrobacter sp. J47]MEE2529391.1 lytic transglycosylase domain-containing protein [Pseudarthrobacter sp. J75]MEE2569273.1 lytic transglycosylase domain-containing protein [Pseudarthrobacter sp. J64]
MPAANASDDAPPSGYPSWQDVENAKQSESAKASEIATITGLLDGLQSRSEELGDVAVASAAEYAVAKGALDAASARLDRITAQSAKVNSELTRYKKEIGALAAESYKTGGTNMGLFVAMDAVRTDSVHGLNIVQVVGDKTAALVAKAAAAEKAANAQAAQERVAKAEREQLAAASKSTLDDAVAAQAAVAAHLAEQQKHGTELTAQLASLKGTTAAVESEFRHGQVAIAAYESAQAAKRAAAEERARRDAAAAAQAAAEAARRPAVQAPAPPAPAAPAQPAAVVPAPQPPAPAPAPAPVTPPPAPPVVPVVPGGAVNNPAGAQAYASSRLGAFGWGQDQFQCLVNLWNKESNWLTTATNPYSGAYGIAQSLPASKYASAGSDWLTNYRTQVEWGLSYIDARYGSPCGAWAHSVAVNWY